MIVKRLLRLIVIAAVTVLLTLIGFEIVVRAVPLFPDRLAQPNALYGWEYPANGRGVWLNAGCPREFVNLVTFNSHGLHDVEHTYARPDGIDRRVLFLGDSMVAALEVPVEQAMPRLAEAALNALDAPLTYETIAVGHQGYGVDLSRRFYEEVAHQYAPDLVVFVMQPHNDITDNYPPLRGNLFAYPAPYYSRADDGTLTLHPVEPYQPTIVDTLRGLSRGFALLELRLSLAPRPAALPADTIAPEADQTAEADFYAAWQLTFALLDALRDRVEADGARFAVIIDRSAGTVDSTAGLHAALSADLAALGITYLSLREAQIAADRPDAPVMFPCDRHWTAYGHQVVAEAVVPFVRAQF